MGDLDAHGDELGKVFVGGLSWDTNYDSLLKYFSRYGEVIDCVVMKNPATGKSRGFGFVKFRDASCVETVLVNGPHVLDGRQVDPKACNPRSMNKGSKSLENRSKKIFIGGLPPDCTETQLKEVFGQYGKVTDVVIMFDQQKQRSRGFGFLSYETEEGVDRVCQQHYVQVGGKKVECKRAEPRDMKAIGDMGFKHLGPALTLSAGGLLQAGLASSLASGQLALPGMGMGMGMGMFPGGALAGSGLPANALSGPGLTAAPMQSSLAPGVAFLTTPPGLPLTFAAGGMGMTPAVNGIGSHHSLPGILGSGSGAEADIPAGYTPVAVSRHNAFLPAHLASAGALYSSAYSPSALAQVPTLETQEGSQAGYLSPSPTPCTTPVPQQTIGENSHSQSAAGKNGYIIYNSCYSGMLGSYPQEASSYGPARSYLADASSGNPTPYTASVTYAPSPALAALQGAYASELSSAYGGAVALPTLAYGGQGDAPHASYASPLVPQRSASATQAFHPYRR